MGTEQIRLSVIDIGTTALDVKTPNNIQGHPYQGGLGLVGPDNRDIQTGIPFEEPPLETLLLGHAGGIGNAANAIAPVLHATLAERDVYSQGTDHYGWAIMAWLGNDPQNESGIDTVGDVWKGKIDGTIDTSLLQPHPQIHHSGLAHIQVQPEDTATPDCPAGERAIYFRAGASGATIFTEEHLQSVRTRNPFNIHISYPGLFPDGADISNGMNLRWFTVLAKRIAPCVSMDIHGFTQMQHVEKALPVVDIFNANFADAARVFLCENVNEHMSSGEKLQTYHRIASIIREQYLESGRAAKNRYRMFTITDKGGTYLIFKRQNDETHTAYLPSPCAKIPAKDKTGAGDVRFGLQRLYMATIAKEKWESGEFTWDDAVTAVNVGQIGATLHIQGRDAHALDGVSLYTLERLAKSGNEYPHVPSLQAAISLNMS